MSKCPKCGDDHSVQKLVYRSDGQNLFECMICGHQWLNPVEVKLTNGDRIRQMSNRELAELITPKVMFCNGCPVKCAEKDIPQRDSNDPFGADVARDVCVKRVENWLNSEVEE